eukprot:CAMPEP_0197675852 /NCGR_PEP_ID=MMETSP1338-20131121/85726_1 /TAXON_ID=43686 ORGANISM="Pelagodinium beii, Strain RCC1491" /NCGR_SAMPLE_ID=MMETSP1338 /ASSEMBLY_ACC=CAM_ASM_000754 /LENGTH=426 /DNA_ID=CAMNT_0043256457 /DNA_START=9 /DNA_END=1285 /DNA_ORIENTATION=+
MTNALAMDESFAKTGQMTGFSRPRGRLPKIESGVGLSDLQEDNITPRRKPVIDFESTLSPISGLPVSSGDEDDARQGTMSRQASPSMSVSSLASSGRLFAEPAQTVLFLDWDDTIFPCSELFFRWGLPRRSKDWSSPLDPRLNAELEPWRRAVEEFLQAACAVSDRCVIVTNSKEPWVTACVNYFAPALRPIFDRKDGPQVVYAAKALRQEHMLQDSRSWLHAVRNNCCLPSLQSCRMLVAAALYENTQAQLSMTPAQRSNELMKAKLAAMRREASSFYSQYPGQTWKNVLSLGDMRYEHEACKALSASRVPTQARERLRTKSFILPTAPTLGELTLQLRTWSLLLPVCARFDGELDMDLSESASPFEELSRAMHLPQLSHLQPPCYDDSFGFHIKQPQQEAVEDLLDELAVVLHDAIPSPGTRYG